MSRNVQVSTVWDDEEDDTRQQKLQATVTTRRDDSGLAGSTVDQRPEPLGQVIRSLREQLDSVESTYDASRINAVSLSRECNQTADTTSKDDPSAASKHGNALQDPTQQSTNYGLSAGRLSTPSRQQACFGNEKGLLSSPTRFTEGSVMTQDTSLQSDTLKRFRPSTRTPPRSTASCRQTQPLSGIFSTAEQQPNPLAASLLENSASDFLAASTRTTRTPIQRAQHSPPPTTTATTTATPSQSRAVNQSFVSAMEPEPVQTPNTVSHGLAGSHQPLAILDSLVGTVQSLQKHLEEQEIRLQRVERNHVNLEEQVQFWRAQANRWRQEEPTRNRDWFRQDERRDVGRQYYEEEDDDVIPELHRDDIGRREWRREQSLRDRWQGDTDGLQDPPNRDERTREWERRSDYHQSGLSRRRCDRNSEWEDMARRSAAYYSSSSPNRINVFSPGSQFVEELSDQLPLDTDQYEVLVSLMDRYLVQNGNGRQDR